MAHPSELAIRATVAGHSSGCKMVASEEIMEGMRRGEAARDVDARRQ
jgi:hypothetical protein